MAQHRFHKNGCDGHIFKTTCPECKEVVFAYNCTCHSFVRLDQNEPPWTPHDCGWSKQLSALQEIEKQKYGQSKLIKRADIIARRKRKLGIPTVLEKPKKVRKKAAKQRRQRAKTIRKLLGF